MQFSVADLCRSLKRLTLVLLLLLSAIPARSAIVAYDTFDDYNAHNQFVNFLFIQNSGVGLRGYWDTIVPDSFFARADLYRMVAPGISGAGGVQIVANAGPNEAVRYLEQPITEGRTVYIGAEIEPAAFQRDVSTFGINLVFEGLAVTAGLVGGGNLGISGADSTTRVVAGTTYFLVVKVELLPGKDRLSLYNITSLSTIEPEPIAVSFDFDLRSLERIGFGTRSATVSYDSLVVADTFSEVIFPSLPEPPKISWILPTINEGNAGSNNHIINFSLTPASSRTVRFSYRTFQSSSLESAQPGEDLLPLSGEVVFPPGTTSQTLTVSVIGDTASEIDERVPLFLYTPVNAAFVGTSANEEPFLRIKNDDNILVQPNLTIQRQTDNLLIQWNAGSGGGLEYTEHFPPTNGWTRVYEFTPGPTYSAILPVTDNPRYFRTRR